MSLRRKLPDRTCLAALAVLLAAGCSAPAGQSAAPAPKPTAVAGAADVVPALDAAARHVDATIAAVQAGDHARAMASFKSYDDAWEALEDGVKARSPQAYEAIEEAADNAEAELRGTRATAETQLAALTTLRSVLETQKVAIR